MTIKIQARYKRWLETQRNPVRLAQGERHQVRREVSHGRYVFYLFLSSSVINRAAKA